MAKKSKSNKMKKTPKVKNQVRVENQSSTVDSQQVASQSQNPAQTVNIVQIANHPRISVVIPIYNAEKFVETCVESVIAQTFQNFEIILIDDCSTDQSFEIIQKYSNDLRIHILKNSKRLRCDETRSLGITHSRGEYIYFMDADDAILPNALETFVAAADTSRAEVVLMNCIYTTEDEFSKLPAKIRIKKRPFNDPTPRFLSDNIADRLKREFIHDASHREPWTRIQRRDFLLKYGITFPQTARVGDMLFHLAELCCAKKIQVIDACCYVWRKHPGQTVKMSMEENLPIVIPSIPIGMKYIQDLFESQNLLANLSEEDKTSLKFKAFLKFLTVSVSLGGGAQKLQTMTAQIESIIRDAIKTSDAFSPEFIVSLFDTFFAQIFEIDSYQQDLTRSGQEIKSPVQKQSTQSQQSQSQSVQKFEFVPGKSYIPYPVSQVQSSYQENQRQSTQNKAKKSYDPSGARLF